VNGLFTAEIAESAEKKDFALHCALAPLREVVFCENLAQGRQGAKIKTRVFHRAPLLTLLEMFLCVFCVTRGEFA
jgi:hypothetical protein